jgi:hypothetical protein
MEDEGCDESTEDSRKFEDSADVEENGWARYIDHGEEIFSWGKPKEEQDGEEEKPTAGEESVVDCEVVRPGVVLERPHQDLVSGGVSSSSSTTAWPQDGMVEAGPEEEHDGEEGKLIAGEDQVWWSWWALSLEDVSLEKEEQDGEEEKPTAGEESVVDCEVKRPGVVLERPHQDLVSGGVTSSSGTTVWPQGGLVEAGPEEDQDGGRRSRLRGRIRTGGLGRPYPWRTCLWRRRSRTERKEKPTAGETEQEGVEEKPTAREEDWWY